MKRVETHIENEFYQKIKESGASVYQFVGQAISEKLMRDDWGKSLDGFEIMMNKNEVVFEQKLESAMKKIIEVQIQNQLQLNERINQAFNHLEGSNKEYNRILNILNQNIEDIRNQMRR